MQMAGNIFTPLNFRTSSSFPGLLGIICSDAVFEAPSSVSSLSISFSSPPSNLATVVRLPAPACV